MKRQKRGFTLVELLVSLTGALFLSIAMFSVAKHTSGLYQRESRVANANLSSVIGFERLRADIARAGFMASPNIARDPFICGNPVADATWPAQLKKMASIFIEDLPATDLPTAISQNELQPQRITLAGNYTTAEAFPIRAVFPESGNYRVHLQVRTGPMMRFGYADPDANQSELLETMFPIGRAVRIVDKSGRHHYGTIATVNGGDDPYLTLKGGTPELRFRSDSAVGCGLKGEETGAMINTVNFIQYTVRSLSGEARYAPLYTGNGPSYESTRTELVREELDPAGNSIPGTAELVAEYAVDLRFRLVAAPSPSTPLVYVDQSAVGQWAGDPTTLSANRGPQMVRAVHTWLSVRSREADRDSTIAVTDGPIYRFGLGSTGGAPFARVRTVQARIALHNQTGVTWQ